MAIPVIYNVRSVKARWTSAIVAVLGIAGHRRRFHRDAVARPRIQSDARRIRLRRQRDHHARRRHVRNDVRRRARSSKNHARRAGRRPWIPTAPLVTSEVVVIAPFPLKSTGTDANVQVRGVSANVMNIRRNVKIIEGRMFNPGLSELVVGKNANGTYSGLIPRQHRQLRRRPLADRRRVRRRRQRFRFRSLDRRARSRRCLQAPDQRFSVRHRSPDVSERIAAIQRFRHRRPAPQRGR